MVRRPRGRQGRAATTCGLGVALVLLLVSCTVSVSPPGDGATPAAGPGTTPRWTVAPAAPTPTPRRTPRSSRVDLDGLLAARVAAHATVDPGWQDVRSILVAQDGRTVGRYPTHPRAAGRHAHVWSVTKSVVALLVGVAIAEGEISGVDATLGELLPDYEPVMADGVADITLEQVLTMRAGFGLPLPPVTPEGDVVADVLAGGTTYPPGSRFAYSSAGSHLLSAVLVEATGTSVLDHARTHLFDPMDIPTRPAAEPLAVGSFRTRPPDGFTWPVDAQGRHLGNAGLALTPQDLLRLGRLVAHGGVHDGERLVPEAWVRRCTAPHVPTEGPTRVTDRYGYQWWVTETAGHRASVAAGTGGQALVVVPDLRLVVATTVEVRGPARLTPAQVLHLVDRWVAPAVRRAGAGPPR